MASTYTANLGIEKPGSGEQAGTWGTTTNTNFDIIDAAVNGVLSLPVSGNANLTTTDGAVSNGGHKVLVLTNDSLGGAATLTILPNDQDKLYLVKNSTGQTITFSQGSGNNAEITNGETAFIFADGAGSGAAVTKAAFDIVNDASPQLGGNLDVNGNSLVSTSDGNIVLAPNGTGKVVVSSDLTVNTITSNAGSMVFEGATADAHETTLAITDPTADRTITFPDASGTVALSADVSSAVPAGTVLVTARSSAPTGYLLCDGASISRSTYSDLFSAIGTTYGSVDSNTFNVPDLRGRVVAGKDDMGGSAAGVITSSQSNSDDAITGATLGDTGGDEVQDLQETHLPAHTHSVNSVTVVGQGVSSAGGAIINIAGLSYFAGSGSNNVTQVSTTGATYTNGNNGQVTSANHTASLANTGSGTAVNNMQPTMILNYMIKT
jgi:microcystin-dependent protein